jgi:hypothetical protein
MLGKKGDDAVLGSLTLAEFGLVLNPSPGGYNERGSGWRNRYALIIPRPD